MATPRFGIGYSCTPFPISPTPCHGVAMPTQIARLVAKATASRTLPPPEERRAVRERAGCSQDDVAAALHVTRAAVSRWESGERAPRGELLVAYVKVLDALRKASTDAA